MRFRAGVQNINLFTKLTASLSSLGPVAWVRLDDHDVRFTIIPENGTQVWAVVQIDSIFDESFTIQSALEANAINLEVPLQPLHRALKSAQNAIAASIRLTKKDNIPLLSLTITTSVLSSTPAVSSSAPDNAQNYGDRNGQDRFRSGSNLGNDDEQYHEENLDMGASRSDRDTIITQDVPVRVLTQSSVQGLHEPMTREPDVHITFPSLVQLKSISDRFTKLALSTSRSNTGASGFRGSLASAPKLELSANMHGCLRLSLKTDAMNISSTWTGLTNPELDPSTVEGGEDSIATHPSTRMKQYGDAQGLSDQGWATVRVEGKDWGKVLGVGRLGGRVIACEAASSFKAGKCANMDCLGFCHENALILYVYLGSDHDDTESVLTVSLCGRVMLNRH